MWRPMCHDEPGGGDGRHRSEPETGRDPAGTAGAAGRTHSGPGDAVAIARTRAFAVTELQVGVHGLRTFRVSDDGHLLPVTAVDDSWRGGVCVARCRRRASHRAPADRCRCGIYTFRNLTILRDQYEPARLLVAVVALEGQTLAGSRGWRSQAGRVVALWLGPDALPGSLIGALARNLPDVPFFDDVDVMLAPYPELSVDRTPGLGRRSVPPAARAVVVLRRRPVRVELVPLYLLWTAVTGWLFVTAEPLRPPAHGGQTGLLAGIGSVGRFLASADFALVIPLLMIGFLIAARQSTGPLAHIGSLMTRVGIPLVFSATMAALLTGQPVGLTPFGSWLVALWLWQGARFFLFSVGSTDGFGGFAARSVLRAVAQLVRTLAPSRRQPGVDFCPRPDHPVAAYPLTIPVHFRPLPPVRP